MIPRNNNRDVQGCDVTVFIVYQYEVTILIYSLHHDITACFSHSVLEATTLSAVASL